MDGITPNVLSKQLVNYYFVGNWCKNKLWTNEKKKVKIQLICVTCCYRLILLFWDLLEKKWCQLAALMTQYIVNKKL